MTNEDEKSEVLQEKIARFQKLVDESHKIVFFGGAGVSTESGIPDFRSQDGLYRQEWKYPPETIISRSFFDANPREFYRFYRDKLVTPDAKPNMAHLKLAQLEKAGKLSAVVTQNIDGLHQMAGSKKVFELHGAVSRNFCLECGKRYPADYIMNNAPVPRCSCGGLIKPDVVLYNEGLDDNIVNGAVKAISSAELLIVGGTSLVVYPAAGLLRYFKGKHIVLINKSATSFDKNADLVFNESIGEVFRQIEVKYPDEQ